MVEIENGYPEDLSVKSDPVLLLPSFFYAFFHSSICIRHFLCVNTVIGTEDMAVNKTAKLSALMKITFWSETDKKQDKLAINAVSCW